MKGAVAGERGLFVRFRCQLGESSGFVLFPTPNPHLSAVNRDVRVASLGIQQVRASAQSRHRIARPRCTSKTAVDLDEALAGERDQHVAPPTHNRGEDGDGNHESQDAARCQNDRGPERQHRERFDSRLGADVTEERAKQFFICCEELSGGPCCLRIICQGRSLCPVLRVRARRTAQASSGEPACVDTWVNWSFRRGASSGLLRAWPRFVPFAECRDRRSGPRRRRSPRR